MLAKKLLLSTAALAAFSLGAPANAAVVYQSLPDLTVQPAVNAWCSSCSGSYKIYDTFTLSSATVLDQVTFAVQSDYNFPTTVDVGFYNLAGDLPGSQIASYSFAPADFVSTVATAFNTTLVTVNLPGLSLASGSYDISFYSGDNLGVPGYAKSGGKLYQEGNQFHYDQVAAFSLSGDAGAVPEPATWAMMIAGFGAVGFAMRRRRNVVVSFA